MIQIMTYFNSLVFLLIIGGWLGACTKVEPIAPEQVARNFVVSLNNKDMVTLTKLCAKPFLVRHQEWQSAPGGSGFILGKVNDLILSDQEQITNYFIDPANKIAVESEMPDAASLSLLADELKGLEKHWAGLSIQLFRRGMGDVEHIFVVGVNSQGKVAAIYLN